MFNLNFGWIYTYIWLFCGLALMLLPHFSLQRQRKIERIVKKTPAKSDPLWVLNFNLGIYYSHILCRWQIVSSNLQRRQFICQTLKWRRSRECCIDILPFWFLIFHFVRLPPLKKCEIFSKKLVDPLLVDTYGELPKLPRQALQFAVSIIELLTILLFRMADFSSTWGPPSDQGSFMLSQIKTLYKSPNMKWVVGWSFCSFNINSGLDILSPLSLLTMTRLEPLVIFPGSIQVY